MLERSERSQYVVVRSSKKAAGTVIEGRRHPPDALGDAQREQREEGKEWETREMRRIVVTREGGRPTLHVDPGHPLARYDGRLLRIVIGQSHGAAGVRVAVSDTHNPPIRLNIGKSLPWPARWPMPLAWREGKARHSITLGPLIGILAHRYPNRRYGAQDSLFRRMIQEADALGACVFVFSPSNVDYAARRVTGYRCRDGRWVGSSFPLPNVIYNRTQTNRAVAALEHRLRRIPIFNSRLGSKWHQARVLSRDATIRSHLPYTRLLRRLADLKHIVSAYGGAYVKPNRGGFGRGIWRVERSGNRCTVYFTDGRGRTHSLGKMSLSRAYAAIRRTGKHYIAQQRLRLIDWHGGIADVRALVQKDISGRWSLTGAAVRAGHGRTIVSNLAGGGHAVSLNTVLHSAFPGREAMVEAMEKRIGRLALAVAERFERHTPRIGELGVDLGVDLDGNIWFLEANSRTGRSLFHRLDKEVAGLNADRRPMEYAVHLSGFGAERSEQA